ncbi:hypothetical protein EYF80_004019 [Liparis tanakae]|uniref:Uncharacterized protein n=1 Tax=Liparis tanakae TaxID=230148 RepID=A0A4Z2J8J2_9TELE|nr:hypothetical protein EYF80_004019 [Liparis tanakae]
MASGAIVLECSGPTEPVAVVRVSVCLRGQLLCPRLLCGWRPFATAKGEEGKRSEVTGANPFSEGSWDPAWSPSSLVQSSGPASPSSSPTHAFSSARVPPQPTGAPVWPEFAVGDAAAAPVAKEKAAGCLNNNGRLVNIPTFQPLPPPPTPSTLLPSIIPLLLSPSLHPLEVRGRSFLSTVRLKPAATSPVDGRTLIITATSTPCLPSTLALLPLQDAAAVSCLTALTTRGAAGMETSGLDGRSPLTLWFPKHLSIIRSWTHSQTSDAARALTKGERVSGLALPAGAVAVAGLAGGDVGWRGCR